MFVSPAKTAEPITMLFWGLTRVGLRNHVLDGGPDPLGEGAIFRVVPRLKSTGRLCCCVPKKTAEPIKMPFGGLTPRKHVLKVTQGRTNPFATTRGDKMVMRPFVKILLLLLCYTHLLTLEHQKTSLGVSVNVLFMWKTWNC